MIAFLHGELARIGDDSVIIDVNGVGYEVKVSLETISELASEGTGNEVTVHTYTYLREDQIALYGFLTADDLALFKMLITVSGIGPKGGLALLSGCSADELRFAILTGDVKTIQKAPGIGKRTAERVILELRDKLSRAMGARVDELLSHGVSGDDLGAGAGAGAQQESDAADAADALVALGYSRQEALQAVRQTGLTEDTEKILREALRYL